MNNFKLKALKDFSASHGIAFVSNDYSPEEYSDFLQPMYPSQENRVEGFHVSYDALLKTFGKPPKEKKIGFDETDWIWLVTFKDGAKASVSALKEIKPFGINAKKNLEQITYWTVSGMNPKDYIARIKQAIKEKGGKLLKENKLQGFKNFYNRYKIIKLSGLKDLPKTNLTMMGQFFKNYNEIVQLFGKPFVETLPNTTYSAFMWVITFADGKAMYITSNYIPKDVTDRYLKTGSVSKADITVYFSDKWTVYGTYEGAEEKEDLSDRLKFILGQTKINLDVVPWTRRNIEENNKLINLKSFFSKLQFRSIDQQTLKNWEKNINNEYRFDNYVHADPTDDFYASINNLKSKFGEPRIERDVNPRNGDTIIYNWGIEFGDGNKVILQGLTNEDAMEMFGELDPDEDHPWDVYVANDQDEQNALDVVERIKTILNKQIIKENNKILGFKQFLDTQQFEISKDPNFSDAGFECLGSFVSNLKEVKNKFGEPQKLNLPAGNFDPWKWDTSSQSLFEYVLWAFTFKDGLKCIITPGLNSNMMDYLKNTQQRQNHFNYDLETANERWYVYIPSKKSKAKTTSKPDLKNRISSMFPNSEVYVQEESNKLEGLKAFQKSNKIIEIVNPDRLAPEIYKYFAFQINSSYPQLEKRLGTVFHYPHFRMDYRFNTGWGIIFGDGTLIAIFKTHAKGSNIDYDQNYSFDVWSNKKREEVTEKFNINNIPLNII